MENLIEESFKKLVQVVSKAYNIPSNENLLRDVYKYKQYKKKEFLCRAGDIPDYLYFIYKGLIRFFYIDYEGKEYIKDFYYENSFTSSYSSFLYRLPSPYYIEALEETHVLRIDFKTYACKIENDRIWAEIARKTAEYLYYLKEKRESSLRLENASMRYLRFAREYSALEGRLKQKDIASFFNIMSPELNNIPFYGFKKNFFYRRMDK